MTRPSLPSRKRAAAKWAALALALLVASPLTSLPADARAGGGFSFGSRGTRTFSAPPTTATAPRPAMPFQQSETARPGFNTPGGFGAQPRRFGFGSGLAAGLLGAGLFGLLTGNGFFGGIGGISSLFGLLFQLLLIYGLVRLAMAFFRNRAAGQTAGGWFGQPGAAPVYGGAPAGPSTMRSQPIQVAPSDFTAFERSLVAVQAAYTREDMGALSSLATPEMVRTFAAELQGNASRGIHNTITGVQLHQGDLAEAWREGSTDYASVAMRFGCIDLMVERATQRIVQGDPNRPVEVTEIWTFRRDGGGAWLLSAIQQTN